MREIARGLDGGANPIVAVPRQSGSRASPGLPPSGLYLAETFSRIVWHAPAASLPPWAGAIFVIAERKGLVQAIRPRGTGFVREPLPTTLPRGTTNFEHAVVLP